jgi:hypothetical protein
MRSLRIRMRLAISARMVGGNFLFPFQDIFRSLRGRIVVVMAGLMSVSCVAAQEAPSWELHGGYQLVRADITDLRNTANAITDSNGVPRIKIGNHLNAQGWDASVQENKSRWFGGIIDVSGSYLKHDFDETKELQQAGKIQPNDKVFIRLKPAFYTVAGGPQFTYRRSNLQPFFRVMFGAVHARGRVEERFNNAVDFVSPEISNSLCIIRWRRTRLSIQANICLPSCGGLSDPISSTRRRLISASRWASCTESATSDLWADKKSCHTCVGPCATAKPILRSLPPPKNLATCCQTLPQAPLNWP